MKLTKYTEAAIKQLTGSTIFGRGNDYYKKGMVMSLAYDSDNDTIQAQVAGNYGDYEVIIITGKQNGIQAHCNCPFDGWPCKHVAAVLLSFIHQKEDYIKANKTRKKADSALAVEIKKLSKDALANLVIIYAQKYPDVKRDLMVRLESNKKTTFETIQKHIYNAFPSIESQNYSTSTISKKISTILQSVEDAPSEMQAKVYWAAADATLSELDAYGIYDDTLEDIVIDTLESLVDIFTDNESLNDLKSDIIDGLMSYYISGNSGITDLIYETVSALCREESDYRIMINRLNRSGSSYHKDLLAGLYAAIGDTDTQQKVLESKLEYGMDYWKLATYWFDQGDRTKGFDVILDGIEKGKGRKNELYEALQKHYQEENNYDNILKLLQQKIDKNELDQRMLRDDGAYQCLWDYYSRTNDYSQQKRLLELCLKRNDVDLFFYRKAEKTLNKEDWKNFESKIITNLQNSITREQEECKFQRWHTPYGGYETSILAEIYNYKKEVEKLFEIVKGNVDLLQKYESLLLPNYASEYLKVYKNCIDCLITARGRKSYQSAVAYVKKVKQIYTEMLQNPSDWKAYITHLRTANKSLRALQDELSNI